MRSVLALCFLSSLAPSQGSTRAPEELFHEAFYRDRGERDVARALRLYRKFLEVAPKHERAGDAARYALNLLKQNRRNDEAQAFSKKWAALLQQSVKPGINSNFLDPTMSVDQMRQRFEGESREVFRERNAIAKLVGLAPGESIADIGAGTGLFTFPFSRAVGDKGSVYAVEIAPRFLEHLTRLSKSERYQNVKVVACSERSAKLPKNSVDVVFICDTYHHFEFPKDTMASIHAAMRPGGRLVIIDFERIPGKSRKWILGHVRAGKQQVIREIESAGFRFVAEQKSKLRENYFIRFVRE